MSLKTKMGVGFGALLGVLSALTALILVTPFDGLKIVAVFLLVIGFAIGLGMSVWIFKGIKHSVDSIAVIIQDLAAEKVDALATAPAEEAGDEIGTVTTAFRKIAIELQQKTAGERSLRLDMEGQAWVKSNISEMMISLQGTRELGRAAQLFMNMMTPLVEGSYGTFYLKQGEQLTLLASYALENDYDPGRRFHIGRSLIGQCALDAKTILLRDVPANYLKVNSSLGQSTPVQLIVHPVVYEKEVMAVLEIASLRQFTELERQLMEQMCSNLGILLNNIKDRSQVEALLRDAQAQKDQLLVQAEKLQTQNEELQAQTEELQAQTEELQMQSEELVSQQESLKSYNERLEKQTQILQASEEELQQQQEELEESNHKLSSKAQELEAQIRLTIKQKAELEQQAKRLELASKYKSEFLANMSHELRTPLNSLLILSQLLGENRDGNLQPKQLEYAQTIHSSGSDLLRLINEILDLAKIESGKMDITIESVQLVQIQESLLKDFQPLAQKKKINFTVEIAEGLPETIKTDGHRLQQILRNLLSNALKFTLAGEVQVRVDWASSHSNGDDYNSAKGLLAFAVTDTGIGIPENKLEAIFDSFQQVDGTTSRKFGGSGLGLTISRELARLIGGDIGLESTLGEGSTFTLYVPNSQLQIIQGTDEAAAATASLDSDYFALGVLNPPLQLSDPVLLAPSEIEDDRYTIGPEDQVLLIIEDDTTFAQIVMDMARRRAFKVIVALQGDKGIALAQTYLPDAIILDMHLPVMDGWSVLSYLKNQPETRHIPIFVMSILDETQKGLSRGALAYEKKPIDKEIMEQTFVRIESFIRNGVKRLLIVEDSIFLRDDLVKLIDHEDVHITAASTGGGALAELSTQHFNCIVLGLGLADISSFELLERIRNNAQLRTIPVIIYTGKELSKQEESALRKYADSIIIKNVKSKERLFDETSLFLHRIHAQLPEDKQKILEEVNNPDSALEGKKILLVDDDMRNIFALSGVLERYNINTFFAQNGKEALKLLEQHPDLDLILMDIMMPEMDGYEAMCHIRKMPEFEQLPIIALTAKAMIEDRAKCLEAGASDYISKPINPDQLFSLLKVWLYK